MTSSMFAWYPLVRKRSDFSTRFGVSRRPSRAGSSPRARSISAISSCIRTLYRMGFAVLASTLLASTAALADDADALYANRSTIADARRAAAIWQAAVDKNPADFGAAWKRARAAYWLGGHEEGQDARDREFDDGMAAARKAIAAQPGKPEGHFWLAAVLGAYAQDHGIRGGLKYRGTIRDELETVLKMDPGFQQGSADRALGRWYFQVPGLFGGSKK